MFICPSNRHVQSWLQWTNMGSNVRGNVQYYSTTPQHQADRVEWMSLCTDNQLNRRKCYWRQIAEGYLNASYHSTKAQEHIWHFKKGEHSQKKWSWFEILQQAILTLCSSVKAKIKSLNLKVPHDRTQFTSSIWPENKSKPFTEVLVFTSWLCWSCTT